MVIRRPDGTSWEGDILFDWEGVRRASLMLDFDGSALPPPEEIYLIYPTCPALRIAQSQESHLGQLDRVYIFLYGHTVDELMQEKGEERTASAYDYLYNPQKWSDQMVASMDWDNFCIAYYTFLCSMSELTTNAWEALSSILDTLMRSPNTLTALLSNAGRPSDALSHAEFWKSVRSGLQVKVSNCLYENTCYNAFRSINAIQPFFFGEDLADFEAKYMTFFDGIAVSRIDEACKKPHVISELAQFDIERLFFYEDYFTAFPKSERTKEYVYKTAFTIIWSQGDRYAAAGSFLRADCAYTNALKYAQSDDDRYLILEKQKTIADQVSAAKAKLKESQEESERKNKKRRFKDRVTDIAAIVLAIILLISIPSAILFGILALINIFMPFSKIAFFISLCFIISILAYVAVDNLRRKRK